MPDEAPVPVPAPLPEERPGPVPVAWAIRGAGIRRARPIVNRVEAGFPGRGRVMGACPCVFEGDRQGKTVESTELIVDSDELDWQ
jgi:hypothetical protein